jgi:flagellum-specific ATP synthase
MVRTFDPVLRSGRVRKISATHFEADGPNVPLGTICLVEGVTPKGTKPIRAEVIRIAEDHVVLSPFDNGAAPFPGAKVIAGDRFGQVAVGSRLLGRAVDALGHPIDSLGPITADAFRLLAADLPSALQRETPREIFETGIRAIDGLMTLGKGQRVGIFAPSGAGKTTLMAQIAQQAEADITIICLVGERGREIEAFWNETLTDEARQRSVLVGATSDQPASMRVRACEYALALADHWREAGKHVLLLLDSVTRLAMAMREIGLAAGEPPTLRAYTPGVFAAMPRIVERCGALRSSGAITAIMTVLSEDEEGDDPICELMKSLLDGHIMLSRSLAEQGQFPAIDPLRSISRLADTLIDHQRRAPARQVQSWLGTYEEARTLIEAGLYVASNSPAIDRAIEKRPAILNFLKQGKVERSGLATTQSQLEHLTGMAS